MPGINNNITIDTILNGSIKIKQLNDSYRVGIDAILLASMVSEINNSTTTDILDLGAGVGTVSLCILYRLSKAKITSIEKVKEYYDLCLENIKLNPFTNNRYSPLLGEIKNFPKLFNSFDIVVSNPPYYKKSDTRSPKNILRSLAHVESGASLQDFVSYAYRFLRPRGSLFIIQKTSRILEVLNNINLNYWGNITLYPIYSYESKDADRTIISMKKSSKQPFKITSGIIIHKNDSTYTEKALSIIKDGKGFFIN